MSELRERHIPFTVNRDLLGYNIYRNGEVIAFVATTSYVDNGVAVETDYCYEVTALYDDGESVASNTACASASPEPNVIDMFVSSESSSGEEVTFDISMTNEDPVAGMQFSFTISPNIGDIISANTTDRTDGFQLSTNGSTVLLFSLTGDVIDSGTGAVVTLDILPTGNGQAQACINDLVVSDPSGVQMPANSNCGDLDVDGVSDDGGDDGSTDGGTTGGTTGGGEDGDVSLSFNNVNVDAGYLELYMENSVDVGGFQFDLSGINITGASGGSAADAGFTLSTSESTVLGFSLTGNSIPSGEGVLVSVSFTGTAEEICLENVVLSDPFGVAVDVNLDDCWNSDTTDGGDDGGNIPDPQFFTDLPVATGESSLIVIQSIEGIEVGDEIGVFDMNGVLETVDFPNTPEYGEILVGSAVWTGSQAEIAAIMSIDLSDFNGPTLNGAVDGNSIVFKVWKSNDIEFII